MSQSRTLSREEGLFVGSGSSISADWALYLMAAVLLVGLAWSSIATVDEVTRSDARIVPDGKEQVIASLESGTLGKLLVHEGEEVEAGEPLAELDPTRAEAAENESQAKRLGAQPRDLRHQAEALGVPLKFPEEVKGVQRLVDSETEVFDTRRRVLEEATASINRSISYKLPIFRQGERCFSPFKRQLSLPMRRDHNCRVAKPSQRGQCLLQAQPYFDDRRAVAGDRGEEVVQHVRHAQCRGEYALIFRGFG